MVLLPPFARDPMVFVIPRINFHHSWDYKTTSLNWIPLVMKVDTRDYKNHWIPRRVVIISQWMYFQTTVQWNPRAPRAFWKHHPISSASFNLRGWNLVCATGWPKAAFTKNFSPIRPVAPKIWPNMWKKSQKKREKERVLKMTKKSRKIDHYSENTGPNELKFRLVLGFRHRMPHTKF